MKKKIVLITANNIRHKFFQSSLDKFRNCDVKLIIEEQFKKIPKSSKNSILQKKHFRLREYYEKKFFVINKKLKPVNTKIFKILRNSINENSNLLDKIKKLDPDLIITYGCSILKKRIIQEFQNKIINIHLGLSPYYRGSGTNYWPFVNNELQFVGVTFMMIDEGIDTGPILHQFRARIYKTDNVHKAGNRLIKDLIRVLEKIINNFEKIKAKKKQKYRKEKIFKEKDFDDQSIKKLFLNYKNKSIVKYLNTKSKIDKMFPIIKNEIL